MLYSVRLSDAIGWYFGTSHLQGLSESTQYQRRLTLRALLAVSGNIATLDLRSHHYDKCVQSLRHGDAADGGSRTGRKAESLNTDRTNLRQFHKWLQSEQYAPAHIDLSYALKNDRSQVPDIKLRVPADRFGDLLEAADVRHPRERMVIAFGVYLLRRPGETVGLKWGWWDEARWEISVGMSKTGKRNWKPISTELDFEIRRWKTQYMYLTGRIPQPEDWMIPAALDKRAVWKAENKRLTGTKMHPGWKVDYTRPAGVASIAKAVQQCLLAIGYRASELEGEGGHTLRRSAARAMYERLRELGHDAAIREVQVMMDHWSVKQTEDYIGVRLDDARLMETVKGQSLYDPAFHVTGRAEPASVTRLADHRRLRTA